MSGTLYLCATPIGNMGDITERVLTALKEADLIAAEDTRVTRRLLSRFDIHTPLTSYHEHNRYEKADVLVAKLLKGTNIALVTDAGTPAISDPGETLVAACIEAGVPVTSLPGPSAVITALTLSGLPVRRFVFEGFLPNKKEKKERARVLDALSGEERTIVLYEAPHHLKDTLALLRDTLGEERRIALCRELTKLFEEVIRCTLAEACALYESKEPRGEYVLVIEGRSAEESAALAAASWEGLSVKEHVAMYEEEGMTRKDAMKRVAGERGVTKRDVYKEIHLQYEKSVVK